nr:hypothetical protein [Neorhizobium sp. SOG26]
MPEINWSSCQFDPVSPSDTSMMEGRRSEVVASMTPFWKAAFQTAWLEEIDYGLFDAFVMKASSRGAPFLAYDPSRPRPIAMDTGAPLSGTKSGGGAFNGQAVLQTITNSRQQVIAGLPAGFKLSPGDYIEYRMTPLKRSLHRIMESATANNFGVVTLSVMFGLDTQNFSTAATVHFERASSVMMIDPGSVSAPKSWGGREASFSATEIFL